MADDEGDDDPRRGATPSSDDDDDEDGDCGGNDDRNDLRMRRLRHRLIRDALAGSPVRYNECFDPRIYVGGRSRQSLKGALLGRWDDATLQLFEPTAAGADAASAVSPIFDGWFSKLWKAHCCPRPAHWTRRRYYHTAVHLDEMLRLYHDAVVKAAVEANRRQRRQGGDEEDGGEVEEGDDDDDGEDGLGAGDFLALSADFLDVESRTSVVLATFFHDAAYDVVVSAKSGDAISNEEASAELFDEFANEIREALKALGVPLSPSSQKRRDSVFEKVRHFIKATESHQVSPDNPFDLALFLDLDMAVLGKHPDAYRSYAACIRKEFGHVPHGEFCEKRAEILEAFLERPAIYGTNFARDALEDQARANLRDELASLRRGEIYGEEEEEEEEEDE